MTNLLHRTAALAVALWLAIVLVPGPAAATRHHVDAAVTTPTATQCNDAYVDVLADSVRRVTGAAVTIPPDALPCAQPQRRTTTFAVPAGVHVGGFGDRLLGAVTVFYAALARGAVFGLDWTRPYDLTEFFQLPCTTVTPPGARAVLSVGNWSHFETRAWHDDVRDDVVYYTNARHWANVVRTGANASLVRALHLHELDQATLFRVAVDALLGRPTPKVTRRAASVLPPGLPVVGVQLRVGGAQPKFTDSASRHTLASAACFGEEAARLCALLGGCTVFVTADSHAAASVFKRAYRRSCVHARTCGAVVAVAGDVLHTDRTNATDIAHASPADVDAAWTKSVLDWWLLRQADALVISRSGFGETAGWASAAAVVRRLKLAPAGVTTCQFGELTGEVL